MSSLLDSAQALRPFGVVTALAIILYVVYKYRTGRYRRLDLIIGLLIGGGILLVSIYPPVGNVLLDVFQVRNRLFAVLIFSNFLLFALFFRLLNEVSHNRRTIGDLVRALASSQYTEQGIVDTSNHRIAVIIPAYNEEENIGGVLGALPDQLMDYEIQPLVVADGSDDRTVEIVRSWGHDVALHVLNRGQGDALRTGFDIALRGKADIVVTMDADGQHRAEELERLVKPIINDEADCVIGSRLLGEYEERGGSRHIGILLFSCLISFLVGQRITDCTNGYRAIRTRSLAKLELRESRFSAPELLLEARSKGLRILEVPVTIARRSEGASKKPPGLGYPLGLLRAIITTWLRH